MDFCPWNAGITLHYAQKLRLKPYINIPKSSLVKKQLSLCNISENNLVFIKIISL